MAVKKQMTKEQLKRKLSVNAYHVNPKYGLRRLTPKNLDKAKAITNKWEPTEKGGDLIGNVRPLFNVAENTFEYIDGYNSYETHIGMYKVFSSALLLYRLICLYKAKVITKGPGGYKCTWWVSLKHKETGEVLMFGEWKGAAGIWTKYRDHSDLPKSYKQDSLDLLNLIASNKCSHPYDGCVAGSVA